MSKMERRLERLKSFKEKMAAIQDNYKDTQRRLGSWWADMLCPVCDNILRAGEDIKTGAHKECLVRYGL